MLYVCSSFSSKGGSISESSVCQYSLCLGIHIHSFVDYFAHISSRWTAVQMTFTHVRLPTVCIYPSVYPANGLSVYQYLSLFAYICNVQNNFKISIYQSVCLSICLSVTCKMTLTQLSVCLPIHQAISLSACLYLFASVCL